VANKDSNRERKVDGPVAAVGMGAQLARVEAQVVLAKLFTRFPDLSLAVPESALRYTGRLGMRALTVLPVRLT
jgi:2-hydroxy-5-methyl-1-naphthoate 7-hydroxylase